MKRNLAKLGLLIALVTSTFAFMPYKQIDTGFACYCNGRYMGEYDDVWACWNACPGETK